MRRAPNGKEGPWALSSLKAGQAPPHNKKRVDRPDHHMDLSDAPTEKEPAANAPKAVTRQTKSFQKGDGAMLLNHSALKNSFVLLSNGP